MNLDAIPQELRAVRQWVCWRVEMRENKPTKAPIIPGTNKHASPTDPSTWRTFDAAIAGKNGHSGVGLVLTPEAGFTGIDLDHCVASDGTIAPYALAIIQRVSSYAERTPTDGIRIWIRGSVPEGHKVGNCEMYSEKRFFTVTGDHIETPIAIETRDVSWLYRLMMARVFDFSRNPKLQALLNGQWQGCYPSQSEADLALCNLLANLGLEFPDIDAAFRISGLMREKWDERRGASNYGADTIRKALEGRQGRPSVTGAGVELLRNGEGKPRPLLENVLTILRNSQDWRGVLGFNAFSQRVEALKQPPGFPTDSRTFPRAWDTADDVNTTAKMQRSGVLIASTSTVAQAVECVARENSFHPVRQFLESLQWDGTERLAHWLYACAGAEDSEYVRGIASRALIGACARVCCPGTKLDTLPVLIGGQGTLKSTLLRELAVKPDWFTDHLSDISGKDAKLELAGRWIIELSELSAVRKSEVERVKAFLTTQIDCYRPPYGHRVTAVPRQCAFFGTSNDQQILTDPSGARRFWPVLCQRIDIDAIRANVHQLWAEAYFRYKRGDPWWWNTDQLDALAAREAEKFYEPGPRDELIEAWIRAPHQRDSELPWNDSRPGRVNVQDILVHALEIPVAQIKQSDSKEVARCLRHTGWVLKQESVGPNRGRRYYISPQPPNYMGGTI